MEFISHKLPSGKTVGLRGRTFAEWEEAERRRIESLESIAELSASGNSVAAEALAQRSVMDFRIARLSLCVEGFAGLRDSLDLRDILEIETFCAKLEQPGSHRGKLKRWWRWAGDAGRAQYCTACVRRCRKRGKTASCRTCDKREPPLLDANIPAARLVCASGTQWRVGFGGRTGWITPPSSPWRGRSASRWTRTR